MGLLPHQHMNATVVVACVVKGRDAIFFGPIGFEISKRLVVKATDQGQGVRVVSQFFEVLAMLLKAAPFIPEGQYSRGVLPAVEAFEVKLDVQRTQGDPGAKLGVEAPIDFALGFGRALRVRSDCSHFGLTIVVNS